MQVLLFSVRLLFKFCSLGRKLPPDPLSPLGPSSAPASPFTGLKIACEPVAEKGLCVGWERGVTLVPRASVRSGRLLVNPQCWLFELAKRALGFYLLWGMCNGLKVLSAGILLGIIITSWGTFASSGFWGAEITIGYLLWLPGPMGILAMPIQATQEVIFAL